MLCQIEEHLAIVLLYIEDGVATHIQRLHRLNHISIYGVEFGCTLQIWCTLIIVYRDSKALLEELRRQGKPKGGRLCLILAYTHTLATIECYDIGSRVAHNNDWSRCCSSFNGGSTCNLLTSISSELDTLNNRIATIELQL